MSRIIKKTACFLLALTILISASVSAFAESADAVLSAAITLILSNEGVYTTVLMNDNGAVSIGKVGWHATRALDLLKVIVNANVSQAISILGEKLTNEILTSTNWNTRIFTASEKAVVQKLLDTPESKKAQDEFASSDIMGYINHGLNMGIRDAKALVYFADLQNQMGASGVERVAKDAISRAGSASAVNLDHMYNAAMADKTAGSSPTRRKKSYEYCKGLNFSGSGVSFGYKTGTYKVTADSLRVRKGPGTSYDVAASPLSYGTVVTVTEISGEWGKISSGWICLFYAEYVNSSVSLKGDVNGNGKVDAADARLVLRYSAKLENLTASQLSKADVDGNGKINASDSRTILMIAARLV